MRFSNVVGVALIGLQLSCTAAKAIRPNDSTASAALNDSASAVSCKSVPSQATPLIVDWKTSDQLDLTVAMQAGVALVAYDCSTIRLVKGCSVAGKYAFTPVPSVLQETVQIADADEAKASLPFSGGAIGGGISRGSSIDIGLAYVGKRATSSNAIAKADLVGPSCGEVTHFVHGASIGAFAVATGTKGEGVAPILPRFIERMGSRVLPSRGS